jgi:PAS domain S-box-containing protein
VTSGVTGGADQRPPDLAESRELLPDSASRLLAATRWLMWLLVVPVLALLAVLTWLQYRQGVADAERALLSQALVRAQELEAAARPAMSHVHDLRRLLEARWADPPDAGAELRLALKPRTIDGKVDGWSLDQASDDQRERWGQIWWAPADARVPDAAWLGRARQFVELARVAHQRAPGFEATWFAAGEVNSSFGYPFVDTAAMLRSMGQPSLQAIDAPRRSAAERSIRALAQDPNDITFWGQPYVSQLDGELVVSHGAVVVAGGQYQGEVSVDVRLSSLQQHAARWAGTGVAAAGGRVWVVDQRLNVLGDSAAALAHPKAPGQADQSVRAPLAERLPAGIRRADLDDLLLAPGQMRQGDGWRLMAAQHIGSPWMYVQAIPDATINAMVMPQLHANLALALALLAMFVAGQWLLARRFVEPALAVLNYLRQLSHASGEIAAPRLAGRWKTWVDDVTETFRLQRELQRRERQVEAFKSALVDNTASCIVTTDAAGVIVEFNAAAERTFGWSRGEVIGKVFGDVLVPERHRAEHRAQMALLVTGVDIAGLGKPLRMRALTHDGRELPIEILTSRVLVDGQTFYIGHLTDLTERVEAARQIEEQRDALRRSEKMSAMGSLLAGVAHELNNPLAIVLGRAHLLEEKCESLPSLQGDARRIREAAERCGRIVRTFLDMARSRPAQRGPVALNDLVRAAAEMLGYTFRSHDIELALDLDEKLPTVQADGDQIGQVVLNLMVNAQQALSARAAPRRVRITSGLAADGQSVWVRVTDNGPGVARGARDKLFEPFFTTKPEGIGTGLGLAVSRSIALEHGGELCLEDAAEGAAFRLELPITSRAPEPVQVAANDPTDEPTAARILVVDDEAEIADLIRSMLEAAGYEVATAESGAVALAMLEAAHVDAIVSDLRMPDMDGAALWRAVQGRDPQLSQAVRAQGPARLREAPAGGLTPRAGAPRHNE